jgi:hypothetical protein
MTAYQSGGSGYNGGAGCKCGFAHALLLILLKIVVVELGFDDGRVAA